MRILRICWEWPPPWSGLAPGPYEITVEQARLGHEIIFLAGGRPTDPAIECPGVRVKRLGKAQRLVGVSTASLRAAREYLKYDGKVDVIHGHGPLPVWVHLLRRLGFKKSPCVYHFHTSTPDVMKSVRKGGIRLHLSGRIQLRLLAFTEKLAARTADHMIACSDSVLTDAENYYGAAPERLSLISNGVNCDSFSPDGPGLREKFGFGPGDKVLLFVGVISYRKNVRMIIEALAALPDRFKALIVGPWEDAYKSVVDDSVRKQGLEHRVVFTGAVDYPQLPAVYRSGDIFLLPSLSEGFPKAALEAAASGLPVIASGFSTSEWVPGTFRLLDSEKLSAELLVETILDMENKGKITPEIIARIRESYSWSAKTDQIMEIYERISRKKQDSSRENPEG